MSEQTDLELESDEMMYRARQAHSCLIDASEAACEALGELLALIDHNGTDGDARIERRFGKRILEAYWKADHAYQDLAIYFDDEVEA